MNRLNADIKVNCNNQRLEKCGRCVLLLYDWDLRVLLADHLLQTWSYPRTFDTVVCLTVNQLSVMVKRPLVAHISFLLGALLISFMLMFAIISFLP